jgi:DNA topoisomerase-1
MLDFGRSLPAIRRAHLREISGRDITAKDFRTWAATNLAILALAAREEEKPAKKGQIEAIRQVASRLGNTPAICRKCYIHPAVLEGYLNGDLRRMLAAVGELEEPAEVWRIERTVMRFLSQRP